MEGTVLAWVLETDEEMLDWVGVMGRALLNGASEADKIALEGLALDERMEADEIVLEWADVNETIVLDSVLEADERVFE